MGVGIFSSGICPKVNEIARLEFERTYYDSSVHYTTKTTLLGSSNITYKTGERNEFYNIGIYEALLQYSNRVIY